MPLGQTLVAPNGIETYQCSNCGYIHEHMRDAERCCTYSCEHCGEVHQYEEDADECCAYYCEHCGARYTSQEQAYECCAEPEDEGEASYECAQCGRLWYSQHDLDNCACGAGTANAELQAERERMRAERREQKEIQSGTRYPHEVLGIPVGYMIRIPELSGRPIRLCSVEQELSMGGPRVAKLLYDLQMSPEYQIVNYGNSGHPGQALVKEDTSLLRGVGGEVVYSRFDLNNYSHSRNFSKAIWIIRELRRRGLVKTSRNAGTHIHISAEAANGEVFGPAQMAALHEIFTFAEDVLFSLGAAGWASHRGTQYTLLVPKWKKGEATAGKIVKYTRQDRHYSLNFTRLLNAAQQCSCGACQVGDWAECECGCLSKGTVEWRVFNASTKPETIHGWLLLAHGLTAKAFDHQIGTLDPHAYQDTDRSKHAWILGWILRECPFTDDERRVIISLAKRAPFLEIDWDQDFTGNGEFFGFPESDPDGDEDDDVRRIGQA